MVAVSILVSAAAGQEGTQQASPKPASSGTPAAMPQSLEALEAYVGQKVSSIELAGRPGLNDDEFSSLFVQHAGEPFDPDKVERTLAAIKGSGKFQDVQLSVVPDVEGIRVMLVLQPGLYFGIYDFPGSTKEFSYSRLLQVANYPPEGPYSRRDVTQAAESMTKFLQQNGYFLAKVTPQLDSDAAHGLVNVRFVMELGVKARYGTVTLDGASAEQTARLQAKLKSKMARLLGYAIRRGKSYSLKSIQSATQYMQSALVNQDRLGAQVKMVGAEYDPASNLANITFHITGGPLVHVNVEGAHLWRSRQRRLLPLYQQVGVDTELIQEGRNNLISYFQSKGNFDAVVETSVTKQGTGETILYKITKGPKHKVATVSLDGNKTLGDKQLFAHVSVKKAHPFSHGAFSDKLLRASAKNLEATYRAEGFSNVKVTPKIEGRGGDVDVTFDVNEGPRDTVRELKIVGNNTMTLTQLVPKGLSLVAGRPYSQSKADADRRNITVKYLESGYLTASFRETVATEKSDPHSLTVTYEIEEGPRVIISNVITLGRVHTRQRIIDRAVKLTPNTPLATGNMLSAESRLYTPAVFDWAEVSPRRQITTQTAEDVLVKVHETRRNTLIYGFGFEVINRGGSLPSGTVALPGLPPVGVTSNFVTSEKTFWGPRGSVEYTRRNLFGLAESLSFGALAGRLVQKVTADFQNPSFRGTSFSSDLNASFIHNTENPIYSDEIEQSGFQLQKPLNHKKTLHLLLRYSFSETQITNLLIPDLVPASDLNVRLSTLSATYSRDTRDNQLNATRGIYESVETDLNPAALGSSVSFVKLLAQTAYYKKLPYRVVWANSVRYGAAPAFAGSHVPLSQEFFSGGGSTLRGFPLDGAGPQRPVQACGTPGVQSTCEQITVPEGGRELFIVNSEFRLPLPLFPSLGWAAFYDGGNVFSAIGFHGEYTNTAGGGLRYATPIGPIRFDIGHNMNSPRGVSATQYFVTLGQAF
jgi:outer membrane protein assembly factor BamA